MAVVNILFSFYLESHISLREAEMTYVCLAIQYPLGHQHSSSARSLRSTRSDTTHALGRIFGQDVLGPGSRIPVCGIFCPLATQTVPPTQNPWNSTGTQSFSVLQGFLSAESSVTESWRL